jgi:hypothetical protein
MQKEIAFLLIILVLSILIASLLDMKKESFLNLSPGEFPLSVTEPILYNDYIVQPKPSESGLNASDIYVNYPIYPATSFHNNNIRYWNRPTNGTCTPPEMCGGVYQKTEQNISPIAPVPRWDHRVNYFDYTS